MLNLDQKDTIQSKDSLVDLASSKLGDIKEAIDEAIEEPKEEIEEDIPSGLMSRRV